MSLSLLVSFGSNHIHTSFQNRAGIAFLLDLGYCKLVSPVLTSLHRNLLTTPAPASQPYYHHSLQHPPPPASNPSACPFSSSAAAPQPPPAAYCHPARRRLTPAPCRTSDTRIPALLAPCLLLPHHRYLAVPDFVVVVAVVRVARKRYSNKYCRQTPGR